MYPREALKTLQKIGDVEKSEFDHNKEMNEIKELVDKDIDELIKKAEPFKIESYSRIHTISEIKQCIINNVPVPISIPVYNNLKLDDKNRVREPEGEIEGYHMVIIYGWNKEGFLFQNSWGKDWGDNGTAVLPYAYEINSAWAISTSDNNIYTYETFKQKLIKFLSQILNIVKEIINANINNRK